MLPMKIMATNGLFLYFSKLYRMARIMAALQYLAPIDDRFTTPMTVSDVAEKISGGTVKVPIYDSLGNVTGYKETCRRSKP